MSWGDVYSQRRVVSHTVHRDTRLGQEYLKDRDVVALPGQRLGRFALAILL